jgi:hypothetical protein
MKGRLEDCDMTELVVFRFAIGNVPSKGLAAGLHT